jgi:trehalose synthase
MTTGAFTTVPVAPLPFERFGEVLDEKELAERLEVTRRAAELLRGRAVWCVNSTATGGGVAEMLRSLLAYTRGAGVDTRWLVLGGNSEFFLVTKRLHNRLHGASGDAEPLDDRARAAYDAITQPAGRELRALVSPGDVVILHDPQTAGLAPALRDAGVGVVWRSHIGVDEPDDGVREAWDFLLPYVTATDLQVFSRQRFTWDGLDPADVRIIPPSIDVFSAKNQALAPEAVAGILRVVGLGDAGDPAAARYVREDGTSARVDRRATILEDAPLRDEERVVAQVSRWDRLKDPVGVLTGFAEHAAPCCDAQLLLVGPSVAAVSDDPEGKEVLDEVSATWSALPAGLRRRVHLVTLPMDDAEENAAMVNAIQRRADVVIQKSLAEGFGLTVAEAMWKSRAMVVSGVGGIQDQVLDEVTGLVVRPRELASFGQAVCRLLNAPDLAQRLATAAHERVRLEFLEPRHLTQWVEVLETLPMLAADYAPGGGSGPDGRPVGAS